MNAYQFLQWSFLGLIVGCSTITRQSSVSVGATANPERSAPFRSIFSTKTPEGKCIDYDANHESLRQDMMQDKTYSSEPCPTLKAIGRCSMVFTRGNLQRSVVSYRGAKIEEAEAACNATKSDEVQEISGAVKVTFLRY